MQMIFDWRKQKLAGMFYTYVDTFYVPTYSSREMQYLFSTPSISLSAKF